MLIVLSCIHRYLESMPGAPVQRSRHVFQIPQLPQRDDKVDDSKTFGELGRNEDESTGAALKQVQGRLEEYKAQRGEANYHTTKHEPLGKGYTHTALPAHLKDNTVPFGVSTAARNITAKESIFPERAHDQPEVEAKLYAKSHGQLPVGARAFDSVEWGKTKVDPARTRFGKAAQHAEKAQMAACLNPQAAAQQAAEGAALAVAASGGGRGRHGAGRVQSIAGAAPGASAPRMAVDGTPLHAAAGTATRVVSKRAEDAKHWRQDAVGKNKYRGSAPVHAAPAAFGRPSDASALSAGDCLVGNYSIEEQLPDADLGRATHRGFRNEVPDPNKVFGKPTAGYRQGRDPTSYECLAPGAFESRGITDEDFLSTRGQDEIRDVFDAVGIRLDDETFERIWYRAAWHYDFNGDGQVSIEEFRRAMNEWDDAAEDGAVPQWWEEIGQRIAAARGGGDV